jgi:hypothetical protein
VAVLIPYSRARMLWGVESMGLDAPDRAWAIAQLDDPGPAGEVLRRAPAIADALRARGVPESAVHATTGDLGRHVRRHRALTGRPGLLNPGWFDLHLSGRLVEVGRLQFEVATTEPEFAGLLGAHVIGIHIPAGAGPLAPDVVDDSLTRGVALVRRAWPELGLERIVCTSWLLDPFLAAHLPSSRIAAFARRFAAYAPPVDEPTDPLYFLWGHRDPSRLPEAGRTGLERVVIDRIRSGGVWQAGRGALPAV